MLTSSQQSRSEDRPIYPRTPFLKLVHDLQPPKREEGFSDVIRLGFQVTRHSSGRRLLASSC